MGYEFRIHRAAVTELRKLPTGVDDRILDKLEEMVTNEFRDLRDYDVRKLRGTSSDVFRARIGEYRVFFLLDGDLVVVLHLDDRRSAYRSLGTLDDRASEY